MKSKNRIRDLKKVAAAQPAGRIHPAAIFVALFMCVAVGRLPELFPFLKPLHLGRVTLVAALVSVMLNWKDSSPMFGSLIAKRVIALALIAVLSATYSIWGSRTILFLQNDLLVIVLLFFLVYKTATNQKTFGFYVLVFAAIVAVMSVLALLSSAGGRVSFSQSYDPNDIGLVLLTSSALLFGICTDKAVPQRTALLAISLLGFSSVLATQSRGAFLGLCAVAIFFMLATRDVREKGFYRFPGFRVLAIIVVVVGIVLALTPESSWDRILTVFELESDYNTSTERGRVAIWERGMEAFLQSPWGVGGGAYQAADMRAGGSYMTAHNSFLQIAVELGVVGLLIYLSIYKQIWSITRRLLLADGERVNGSILCPSSGAIALGVRASLIGFSVSGFFLSMAYGRIFFAMLGMVAACELLYFDRDAIKQRFAKSSQTPSRRNDLGAD